MSALDIREAKRSLVWWLREWGVTEQPDRKAAQFIDDMVDRGWIMSPAREARPQPPKAHEQCPRHAGQRAGHCGGCEADKRAAAYDDEDAAVEPVDKQTAIQAARAALVAAKGDEEEMG